MPKDQTKDTYLAISCDFYDELEALATLRETVHIHFYGNNNSKICVSDKIVDFKIVDQAEYLILEKGVSIRLDQLISVNHLILSDWNVC